MNTSVEKGLALLKVELKTHTENLSRSDKLKKHARDIISSLMKYFNLPVVAQT